jgi:hypothetical protein
LAVTAAMTEYVCVSACARLAPRQPAPGARECSVRGFGGGGLGSGQRERAQARTACTAHAAHSILRFVIAMVTQPASLSARGGWAQRAHGTACCVSARNFQF